MGPHVTQRRHRQLLNAGRFGSSGTRTGGPSCTGSAGLGGRGPLLAISPHEAECHELEAPEGWTPTQMDSQ